MKAKRQNPMSVQSNGKDVDESGWPLCCFYQSSKKVHARGVTKMEKDLTSVKQRDTLQSVWFFNAAGFSGASEVTNYF